MGLFAAIMLSSDPGIARLALEIERPLPPAQYHLTLLYLGDHDPADAARRLAGIHYPQFSFFLTEVASFREPGRHITHLRARKSPELCGLASKVEEAMGVRRYYPFTPHVTLGEGSAGPVDTLLHHEIRVQAESFGLYLSANGRYTTINEFPLAPAAKKR